MKRKALALVITVCLVLAMIPMSGFAETAAEKVNLVDANHWAAAQIEKWASVGLILGDERGFRPDDPITRAEMAAILSNLMGYQVKADNTFVDVKDTAWYADVVLKANASGVLSGDGKGHAFPEKHITREEAASMFARAFSVDSSTGKETSFKDSGDISAWARPSVFGMEAYKYIGGKGNGVFAPKANITRAEVVTIVNNAVRAYYTEAGTYTANVEPLTRGGNCVTIVKAADVVIKDALIAGDLIVAEGVGDGDFTLDNTRIEGKMIARGGGDDSIIITGDSSVQNLRIERIDGQVRVFADDGTEVGTVIADGKDDVIIEGAFTEVMVLADDITVTANNANIRSATITGANSNIIIGRYSSVSTITVSGNGTSISGPGRVGTVYANADDISVMTPDTTVTAGLGTQGVTAGDTNVAPGTSQNTSGSRTGRGSKTWVTGINLNHDTLTLATGGGSGALTAVIEPADATNQNIIWSSSDEDVATVYNGTVTPLAAGTTTITAVTADGGYSDTCEVTVLETVDIADISGVVQPVKNATPVTTIIANAQYTGSVSWDPGDDPFVAGMSYTATITLTAKDGYTFTGVEENFFYVEGATSVTNDEDTGIVTAVFPIAVTDASDLDLVRNTLNADYIQMADITLTGSWNPIGSLASKFTGSYDGNGYTISGLTISSTVPYVGLFSFADGADFLNITLEDVEVTGGGSVGGLMGYGLNCSIVNCSVSGSITCSSTRIGGLAGTTQNSTITSSSAICSVSGTGSVGGLIGHMDSFNIAIDCYAKGNVTGGTGWYAGGLVGLAGDGVIRECYATGNVSGVSGVGGLAGQAGALQDCYALGDVTGSGERIGGLVGQNGGPIENCFSAGLVNNTGTMRGGMIGYYNYSYIIISSYYDTITSGMGDTNKGIPMTTDDMKQPETFVGWDFDDIWDIDEGESYPYLKWQKNDEK